MTSLNRTDWQDLSSRYPLHRNSYVPINEMLDPEVEVTGVPPFIRYRVGCGISYTWEKLEDREVSLFGIRRIKVMGRRAVNLLRLLIGRQGYTARHVVIAI